MERWERHIDNGRVKDDQQKAGAQDEQRQPARAARLDGPRSAKRLASLLSAGTHMFCYSPSMVSILNSRSIISRLSIRTKEKGATPHKKERDRTRAHQSCCAYGSASGAPASVPRASDQRSGVARSATQSPEEVAPGYDPVASNRRVSAARPRDRSGARPGQLSACVGVSY